VGAAAAILLPILAVEMPVSSAAPAPLALVDKTAFFDDFETGALDPDRWQVPTAWGVERTRLRPWDDPGLPANDSTLYHLSDTPSPSPGNYPNAAQSSLETAWIDLTEATAGARLRLTQRYDIDTVDDAALVYLRTDSRGWVLVAPDGGYPTTNGFAGTATSWEVATFDLAFYGGSRVKVAFQLLAGDNGAVGDGWQVDSVSVTFTTNVPSPDLRVTEVEVYSSLGGRITSGTAGDVLDLRVNVTNIGAAATTASVPVFFFDGRPGEGRFLGQGQLPSISPLAVASASLRAVLTAGAHNVSVVVDPGGILNELSTANNEARTAITLAPAAGVDLALLSATFEVGGTRTDGARPGQIVRANLTIANLGSVNFVGGFFYGVYLEAPNSTAMLAEATRSLLAAGEVRTFFLNVSAIAGNLSLLVALDIGGFVNESNEANNVARQVFKVTDAPPHDLTIEGVAITYQSRPTTEVAEEDLLVVRAVVRNAGTQAVGGSFTVGVFLGDPDAGGELLWTRTVPGGLPANGTVEVRGTWPAEVGQRTLYAYADLGREVFESEELNNKAYASVHVQSDARANLVVDAVRFTVLGAEVNATRTGAPVMIEVTVRNLGTNATISGEVWRSPRNPWTASAVAGVVKIPMPAVLARNTVAVILFPWIAEPGTAVFFITADGGRATDETDEFDNMRVRTFEVDPQSPDISVSAVSVKSAGVETATLYPELNVTVSAEVTNAGTSSVEEAFAFELWAGDPSTLGAVRLAEQVVQPPFTPGDSRRLQVVWLASFPEAGSVRIVAVADRAHQVIEAERDNNEGAKDLTFVTAQMANLAVDRFELTRGGTPVLSATEGERLTLEITVRNDSPAPYLGGAVLEVRDREAVVFTAPLPRLEPGQTLTLEANWTASIGASVSLLLDTLFAVDEANELDNTRALSVDVTEVPTTPWGLYAGLGMAAAAGGVGIALMRRRKGKEKAPLDEAPLAGAGAAPSPPPVSPAAPPRPAGVPPAVVMRTPPPGGRPLPPRPMGGPPPPGGRPPPPRPMGGPPPGGRPPPPPRPMGGPPPPGWRPPPQRPVGGPPPPGWRPPPQRPVGGPPPPGWRPPPQRPMGGPPPPGGRPLPPRPMSGPPPPAGRPQFRPFGPPPAGTPQPTRPAPELVAAQPMPAAPPPDAAPPAARLACPKCQAAIEPGWVICASCGSNLGPPAPPAAPATSPEPSAPAPPAMKCAACSEPTEAGWAVCPNCGAPLSSPAP